MDSIVSIFLVISGSLLAVAGGFFIARVTGSGRKLKDLQVQLEAKQAELDDYRREVFEQFGETARKFKTLNDSYVDLHQQLAKSASLLCGDLAADTLLEAPLMASIAAETTDKTITIDDDTATVVAHTSSDGDEEVRDVDAVEEADVTVEDVDEAVEEADETVEEADVTVEEVDATVEEVDIAVEEVDEVTPVVQNQATIATPRDVPTLEISQALEAENEVDNSHWVSAMEVVLQKLKQAPSETIGQSDHDSALPLRNAS
ncbi:MAG: DUF1043 family protein [Gammaproteobacteria bacterium]|nr:DUF1043 family protein [Gammaproteobacteria bacterium]